MRGTVPIIGLLLALAAGSATAAEQVYPLSVDDWARPKSGETVVELGPLKRAVRDWGKDPERRIEVRYPGGDQGSLWAAELKDWLISLGVPSARIRTVPGSARADTISLVIVER